MKRIAALLTALLLLAALLTACAKTGSQSGSFFNRGETKAPAATEPKPSEAPSATLPSGVQAVEQTTEPTLPTAPTVPTAPAETDPNGSDPVNLAADVVGTYRLSEFNGMDIREFYTEIAAAYGMSLEDLGLDLDEITESFVIVLQADGTATVISDEEEETGSWRVENNMVAIEVDGETLMFLCQDGEITFEEDEMTVTLRK